MTDKRKTRIAIIIELKKRELSFLAILKTLLEKQGYNVKFISFRNHCTLSILKFRPDIILINGLRTTYSPFVSQIYLPKKLFNSKIICYYSEQVGLYDQTIAYSYNNPLILRNVDCHVSWGRRFSKDLISMGVDPDKSWYIGSMQYDLDKYIKRTSSEFRKEFGLKHSINTEKKWLLYCDNIMTRFTMPTAYPVRREESYKIIESIAECNPEAIIIFRPHPETTSEELSDMSNRFKSYSNVVVNYEGHLFYWLMACDGLLIWQSTSGLQSIFLNKNVFGFKTTDGQNQNLYWYKDMLPIYEDHAKLVEDITTFLNTGECERFDELAPARQRYIDDFYFRKDGLSFNRIIDIINRLDKTHIQKYADQEFSVWKVGRILLYEIKMWIKNKKNGSKKSFAVSQDEIEQELSKYNLDKYEKKVFKPVKTAEGIYLEND